MRYVLLITALLCSSSFAVSLDGGKSVGNVPTKANQENRESTPPQADSKSLPISIDGEVTTKESQADIDRKSRDEQDKTELERSNNWAYWGAVFFALIACAIAGGQLWMFREQLKMTRIALEDSKTSADAAEEAALAAKASAALIPKLERPYIFVKVMPAILDGPQGVMATRPAAADPSIIWSLKNYGRTPAILKEVKYGVAMLSRGQSGITDKRQETEIVIGSKKSGRKHRIPIDSDKTSTCIQAQTTMMHGSLHLSVIVTYKDIFQDKEYTTSSTFRFHPKLNLFAEIKNEYT